MPPEITFLFGFATAFALMFIYRRGFSRGRKETGHVAATRETETRNDYQSQVDHLRQRLAVLERITTDPAPRTARDIDALRDHANFEAYSWKTTTSSSAQRRSPITEQRRAGQAGASP